MSGKLTIPSAVVARGRRISSLAQRIEVRWSEGSRNRNALPRRTGNPSTGLISCSLTSGAALDRFSRFPPRRASIGMPEALEFNGHCNGGCAKRGRCACPRPHARDWALQGVSLRQAGFASLSLCNGVAGMIVLSSGFTAAFSFLAARDCGSGREGRSSRTRRALSCRSRIRPISCTTATRCHRFTLGCVSLPCRRSRRCGCRVAPRVRLRDPTRGATGLLATILWLLALRRDGERMSAETSCASASSRCPRPFPRTRGAYPQSIRMATKAMRREASCAQSPFHRK